jgi:tape measure domain-containing protein
MSVNVRGGSLSFEAVIDTAAFKAQLDDIKQKLEQITTTAEKESKAVDSLVKNTATAIAGYMSLATASNFIGDIVKVRGEFQQLEIAFRTMLKSKGQADLLLAQAVDLAAKTPFTLQDVGGAAKQLLAYGFAAGNVTENIEMLGNIASGVGAPLNDIVYLYGTLKTQGQVFTRDILQFTSRGIPIVEELAKQFGVTTKEVKGMVEAGKVGFPDVERAFRSLTGESGKFYNLMQEQSKSLTGQVSNLQDAWSRMLNEIGKSNEGLLSGALSSAIELVNNYEKVIDVIKILIPTYGTYRTAVFLTNALTLTQAELTAGVTIAQKLHSAALVASEKAMALLNGTMLKNPYVLVATALAAVVAALVVFKKEANGVATAQQLITDGLKSANSSYDEQKAKIRSLVIELQAGNASERQKIEIYNKLNAINPSIVQGLNAQSLSYEQVKGRVDDYVKSLREKIQVEANDNAITKSTNIESELSAEIEQQKKLVIQLDKAAEAQKRGTTAREVAKQSYVEAVGKLRDLQNQYDEQVTQTLNLQKTRADILTNAEKGTADATVDSIKALKAKIAALTEEREAVDVASQEYKNYTSQLEVLNKRLNALTGKADKKSPAETAAERAQKKLNDLLKEISDAEREVDNFGLTSQQAEVARIEAKFDELRNKANELKADAGILTRIDNAEVAAIGAEKRKEKISQYQEYLGQQQQLFSQYQQTKLSVGKENADKLFGIEVSSFDDYVTFLKAQLALLTLDNSAEGLQKRQVVAKQLGEAEKEQDRQITADKIKGIEEVLQKTITFNQAKRAIETKYEADLKILRETTQGEDFKERAAQLKAARDQELADLNSTAARSSGIYKKLNEDILLFTRQQLVQRKKELETYLTNAIGIPPAVRADIQNYIKQLEDLIKETSKGNLDPKKLKEASEALATVSSLFGQAATAVGSLNQGLADTLQTLSDITSVASNVALALANFASGNILGGIAASIGAIIGVFKLFADARKSVKAAQKEMEDFNLKVLSGEIDINVLYRERLVQQQKINQLRLQGLKDESKALKDSAQQNQDDFTRILQLIQREQYVSGQRTEQYGGFLGIGRKTRVVDVYQSLAGKTYDDLEKLFLSGRLEGKAAELFKTLEKLKNEGVNIDQALLDNEAQAKEIFTGSTASGIADSITQGFANGLKSAKDFASSFEDLMKGAILNALKYQTLEGPLKEFYDSFAAKAESDGILTETEIQQLRDNFNGIITNAGDKFDELQKITNIDFAQTGSGTAQKGLAGAIKGITADQADLLAGQFGGLRLTAVDHLNVARQGLNSLQRIELYTSNLNAMRALWERIELTGIKVK